MKKTLFVAGLFLLNSVLSAQTVTGRVVNQNSEGLSGLRLQLYINPNIFITWSDTNGTFTFRNVTMVEDKLLPEGYIISNNYPNPFNPLTRINITLPKASRVNINLYNITGERVRDVIEKELGAGNNFVDIELNGLANGFYIARITIDEKYTVLKKLMLLYGSQHLSNPIGSPSLGPTLKIRKSNSELIIDSLVITGDEFGRRVFTNLPNVNSDPFDLGNFSITITAPGIPTLVSPVNGATNWSTSPRLSWYESSGATSYTLQVSENSTFSNYFYNQGELTITSQQISGLSNSKTYYWRVNASNSYGTSDWSSVWLFTTSSNSTTGMPCPGIPTITDTRDGKVYETVQIRDQCWLKKNLDVGTRINGSNDQTDNGTIEKYCYNDDENNCTTYGGLYQWNEAMEYVTTPGTKGICPSGWYIPTDEEFQTLATAVNNNGNALKEIGQGTESGVGTNTSGFSTLLAGYRHIDGYFYYLGYGTLFWSSTEYNASGANALHLKYYSSNILFYIYTKELGFSVRCLKN